MKKKIEKYWFFLPILLLTAGWFYWFQWRPAEIRKECLRGDLNEIERMVGGKIEINEFLPKSLSLNKLYRICLVGHGMKAEDIIK